MSRCLTRFMLWVARLTLERLGKTAENTTDSRLLDLLADVQDYAILTPGVLNAVLLNRATNPQTLCRLLDDEALWGGEEEARVHVVYNPALPLERLTEVMRRDESEYVRVAAACALAERLSNDCTTDPQITAECRGFLTEIDTRTDEYDDVKVSLQLLQAIGSRPRTGDGVE